MAGRGLFHTLCIRADAGPQIGLGHVMRCLALGQAWRDLGGPARLITSCPGDALRGRMEREGIEVTALDAEPGSGDDARQTARIAHADGAGWLVLDGYHFARDFREAVKAAGLQLLVVDDLADTDLRDADIIVNPNAYAEPGMYAGAAPQAACLLGVPYALLRSELLPWRTQRSAGPEARNIIVTLGGADPGNVTRRIVKALAGFAAWRLRVTVVAGGANPHLESLRPELSTLQRTHDAELAVDPPDLPQRMSGADLAITAAGGTGLELAYLGVPMLATAIVKNQERVARKFAELGLAALVDAGAQAATWREEFSKLAGSSAARSAMTGRSLALVDGRGARRVAEALATHPVTIRPATGEDARKLWEWANDPVTRQASFSSEPIPWDDHLRWLARVLGDGERRLFIAQCEGADIGQLRFDREGREATMSVGLAPGWRGRGLGPRVIRHGAARVLLDRWTDSILALVKPGNEASVRAFRHAGFEPAGTVRSGGHEGLAWRLRL